MEATRRDAAIQVIAAVAEAIKDLHEVPEGHLYAQLMGYLSLETFNSIIRILTKQGYITVSNHLITWVKD